MLRRNPDTGQVEEWTPGQDKGSEAKDEVVRIGDVDVVLPAGMDDSVTEAEGDEGVVKAPKPAEETGGVTVSEATGEVLTGVFSEEPVEMKDSDSVVTVNNGVESTDEVLDFDVPGLTTGDSKKGSGGTKSVLQRLQSRAKGRKNGGQPGGMKVEVSEKSAQARGPAVKDSTEARQKARGRVMAGGRISSKPAPGLLGDQPRWVQDLFEAHFRSSRTGELRRKPTGAQRSDGSYPNRMKMSREDFAIGWLVMLEMARKDPSILRVKGAA